MEQKHLTQQQQQWIDTIRAAILAEAARVDALPPDVSMEDADAAMAHTLEDCEAASRLVQSINSHYAALAVHDALMALQAELDEIIPVHVGMLSVVERVEGAEAEYRQQSDNPYYTMANFSWFDARVSHALQVYYANNDAGRLLLANLAGTRDGDCRTGLVYKVLTRGKSLTLTPESVIPNTDATIEVVTFAASLPIVEVNRW